MKKVVFLLLVSLILGVFSGCEKTQTNEINISSNDSAPSQVISTPDKEETESPLTPTLVKEEKIKLNGTIKTFTDLGVSCQFPAMWNCLQQQGEDGLVYFFRDPDLGENCQFSISITAAEYRHDRTKKEYLTDLSDTYESVTITTFQQVQISGYDATKVEASCVGNNGKFVSIHYDNVVAGVRMYDFIGCYPETEKEIYAALFESMFESIMIE